MKTARLFTTGRSKAVRLPKAWIGDATEVELERKGDTIASAYPPSWKPNSGPASTIREAPPND